LKGPPRKEVTDDDASKPADGLQGDSDDEGGKTVNMPRCYNKHPWQEMATPNIYCQRCYKYGEQPYFCGFCNDGFCQTCYDAEYKKLNPEEVPPVAPAADGSTPAPPAEEEDDKEDEEDLDEEEKFLSFCEKLG
jgi:hypothetical protein